MKRKIKKYTLLAHAIEIMIKTPEITIHDFSTKIGKNYSHAGNLMHQARRHLGRQCRDRPTKVDKTMAILSLIETIKLRKLKVPLEVSYGRAAELKSIAKKRLAAGRVPSEEALDWACNCLSLCTATANHTEPTTESGKLKAIIDQLQEDAPTRPAITYPTIDDGHMAEISIPDLHLGKCSTPGETGETYTPEIACQMFLTVFDDLLKQVIKAYSIERLVVPIGNDFLTTDNIRKTTTRGTPQDTQGSFNEHFRMGWKILREAIDKARAVAPVDIIVVPGNHDSIASFVLGEVLAAHYRTTPDVSIHNKSDQPRKYLRYGDVLLGYAHGHAEKSRSLPMLMATEVPKEWGQSRHREIHLGHMHHTRDTHYLGTNEIDGVILRVIPSLSASDRWHAAKGYRAQRAALAFVYHPTAGQKAIFRHSILDELAIPVPSVA